MPGSLTWWLSAASVLVIVALGLWLATRDDGTPQASPTKAGSSEFALQLNAVLTEGGKPLLRGVRYDVYESAKDEEGKRKYIVSSPDHQGPPRFLLPPGQYYVTATYDSAFAGGDVRVVAGDRPTRKILDLRAGILSISTVMAAGGQPIPRGVRYDVYEVEKDEDGKRKHVTSSPDHLKPPRFPLPARRYYVTATYGSAFAGEEIQVAAGDQPTRQILDLRAGALNLSSVLAAGGEPIPRGVRYDVYEVEKDEDGKRKHVTSSPDHLGPPRLPLPARRYYVTATYGSAFAGEEIHVAAGDQPTRQILNLRAGILSISTVLAAGGEPIPRDVRYDVYEVEADEEGKRKHVTSSPDHLGPPRLPLPARRYYVTAAYGSAYASAEVTVAAGDRPSRQILNLRAGILSLSSVLDDKQPARNVRYQVYQFAKDAQGNRKRVAEFFPHQTSPRIAVPAGRYYVAASSDVGRGDSETAVGQGETRQVQVTLRRP